jgi:hypothetical protein
MLLAAVLVAVGGGDQWRGGRRERFGGKSFWENMVDVPCLTWF